MDASIFDSALSHTRRSDVSEKREENSVSTFGHFRPWTSFESSPVSVKIKKSRKGMVWWRTRDSLSHVSEIFLLFLDLDSIKGPGSKILTYDLFLDNHYIQYDNLYLYI